MSVGFEWGGHGVGVRKVVEQKKRKKEKVRMHKGRQGSIRFWVSGPPALGKKEGHVCFAWIRQSGHLSGNKRR